MSSDGQAPDEIATAVVLEASQVCPFGVRDSAVDYQLLSEGEDNKAKGVMVAAMNTLIESKVRLAKEACLKCILVDVDGLALLNCFSELADEREKAHTSQTTAILNVGGSHMTLAIMRDDGWPFIRDMTYASGAIINCIATSDDMPTEKVKEILFGDSTAVQAELHESLANACQELFAGVTETLRYYATQAKSMPVDKIFVCGGFALDDGFIELLNSRLGAELILWNPFDKMRCDATGQCADILSKTGPAMAVAAGLAMRSI